MSLHKTPTGRYIKDGIPFELYEGEDAVDVIDWPEYIITSKGRLFSKRYQRFIGSENPRTGYKTASFMPGNKKVYIHKLVAQHFPTDKRQFTHTNKPHVTREAMKTFNRWYVEHQNELQQLTNQKVSELCLEQLKLDIHPQTIHINRGKWTINDNHELVRI